MAEEEIAASEFKARCLRLLDVVAETGVEYVVTKHGEPVAKVVPLGEPRALDHSVRVLVDDEDEWFSTADLVDPEGRLGAGGSGRPDDGRRDDDSASER